MDFIKSSLNKKNKPVDGAAAPTGQQQDYGDKGAKLVADRIFGKGKTTDKQREQATDGLRGLYEKFTGKKVDPKYSN